MTTKGSVGLREHIERHWDSQRSFAAEIEIPFLTINQYVLGKRRPNLEHAVAIQKLTRRKGKPEVLCEDWLEPTWESSERQRGRRPVSDHKP